MRCVLLSLKVEGDGCVPAVVNLVRVVSLGLSEKHLHKRGGLTDHGVVQSSTAKVILGFAVDSALLKGVIDALEVLKLAGPSVLRQDMEKILSLRVLRLDNMVVRVLGE